MKKFYYFLIVVLLMTTSVSFSQSIMGGLGLGLNLSQVDGDYKYGFHKFGLNAGPFALIQFNKYFAVSIETVLNQKGSYGKPVYNREDSLGNILTGEYSLRLNYLEVPVLVYFVDNGKALFGTGFSYGRLVSVNEYEHGRKVESTSLNNGPYSVNDFNYIADFKIKAYKNFWVSVRYNYSISKIRTRTFFNYDGSLDIVDQKNNLVTIRLIYLFKDKFFNHKI